MRKGLAATLLAAVITTSVAAMAGADDGAPRQPHLQDYPWVSSTPSEIPQRVPGQSGGDDGIRIRVGRIFRKERRTHASVNVRNVAPFEFHDVTIVCTAFDERNGRLGTEHAELSPGRYGPLKPGFTTDLDFTFDTGPAQVRSLSCDAHARGLPHQID